MLIATYLVNRIPIAKHNSQTPFDLLFHKTLSYHHLRSFGCLCFASNLVSHRMKFDLRARRCIFIEYSAGVKGYKLYNLDSKTCFVSRDVAFYAHIFPFLPSHVGCIDSINVSNLVLHVIPNQDFS